MELLRSKKLILLGLLLCSIHLISKDENPKKIKIDSLTVELNSVENEADRIALIAQIGWTYLDLDNEKSIKYSLEAYQFADSINDLKLKSETAYAIAQAYNGIGDYSNAMGYFSIANDLSREANDEFRVINIENGMGNLYLANEEFKQALVHYKEANRLSKSVKDSNLIGITNMGLGFAFTSIGEHDSAVSYYEKALNVLDREKDQFIYGATYANMATSLLALGRKNDALLLGKKSLNMMLEVGNQYGIGSAYEIVGEVYFEIGQYDQALNEYLRAEQIFKQIKSYDNLHRVYNDLALLYARNGQKDIAYDYMTKHNHLKDSLFNRSKERILAEMESKYENELKSHQIEILNQEKKAQDIELEFQKQEEMFVIMALVALILFFAYVFYFYLKNKKLNKQLNRSITQIEAQKDQIEAQSRQIQYVHQEVVGSIRYAKRIQSSVLPHPDEWKELLGESFIMYMPKDVVSGDFYWMKNISDDEVLFSVFDCTGHGVPGGFMTFVGYHSAERATNEFKLKEPAAILDKMQETVNEVLNRGFGGENIQDGMDAALCYLNKRSGKLQFAGAFNPLWIVRGNEIIEIKGTKQAVGRLHNHHKPFENNHVQLEDGDIIYIFSDGYIDQFGGEFGKKILSKGLKKLLLEMKDLSMKEQRIALTKYLYDWMNKSEEEQGDDVCVMAVKFSK